MGVVVVDPSAGAGVLVLIGLVVLSAFASRRWGQGCAEASARDDGVASVRSASATALGLRVSSMESAEDVEVPVQTRKKRAAWRYWSGTPDDLAAVGR